jgi:hypothetical protein
VRHTVAVKQFVIRALVVFALLTQLSYGLGCGSTNLAAANASRTRKKEESKSQSTHQLIVWSDPWEHKTPAYIAKHVEEIEQLPADGMVIEDVAGNNLFDRTSPIFDSSRDAAGSWTKAAIAEQLRPLTAKTFSRFTSNLGKISMGSPKADWRNEVEPPDLFDDTGWKVVLTSLERYAQVLAQFGISGVMLDDEIYTYTYWNSVEGASKSVRDKHLRQAVLRGQQVGKALQQGNPSITIVVAHGPYQGCDSSPSTAGTWGSSDFLLGAFAAGVLTSGDGTLARLIDGGELYDLRTREEFHRSASFRKSSITNDQTCGFMTSALKAKWSQVEVGFGLFDHSRPNQTTNQWTPMETAEGVADTLSLAHCAGGGLVWIFTEHTELLSNPPADWVKALGDGRSTPCP